MEVLAGSSKMSGIVVVLMVALMAAFGCCSGETLHKVGSGRWAPGVNYTEWASHEHFYVGDWLNTSLISLENVAVFFLSLCC